MDLSVDTWFSASVLFHSIHDGKADASDLWEDVILVVKADTEDEARLKILDHAKNYELSFTAEDTSSVSWVFDSIETIQRLDDVQSEPIEIFSRFLKDSEVASLKTKFDD